MPTAQQYPLAPPSVSGGDVTISALLQQPLRITREVQDYVVLANYFLSKVLRNTAAPTGGAVLYYPATDNDLFGDPARDAQEVRAGSEFPIVGGAVQNPLVEPVKKYGGKFFVTDEDVRRNDPLIMRRKEQQLANILARKIEMVGVAKLNTVAGAREFPVPTWKGVNRETTADDLEPFAGFALLAADAAGEEQGVVYDTLIANPADMARLRIVYRQELPDMLADVGITTTIATPRQPAGTALVVQAAQAGFVAYERPPYTETWRDAAEEVTWVQHGALPAIVIDNQYAVKKLTGIAS